MKKKIISCLVICVVVVLSYFYAYIDQNIYIYNRNTDTASFYGTGLLMKDEEVTQTFIAEANTIDGINVKVSIIGNVENIVLHYSVLNEDSEEVANAQIDAKNLENNKFNKLDLPTITDTAGTEYTLVLSVENGDEQNGVGFFLEPGTKEKQQLSIKDNETEGTLVARIISHRFDIETFVVLLGIVAFVTVFMKILYRFFK